ncbi:hypothetical protein D3C86_2049040 [compost metagenome]
MGVGNVSQARELFGQTLRRRFIDKQRQRQLQTETAQRLQHGPALTVRAQQQAFTQCAEQQLIEFVGVGQQPHEQYQPVGFLGVVPADEFIAEQAADEQAIG